MNNKIYWYFFCILFIGNSISIFAYTFVPSVEVRQFILSKIYQQDIFKNYTNTTYLQTNNQKFSIIVDDVKRTIDIIPEQYGEFIVKGRSSWTISIDNEYRIKFIKVHISDNSESYISFSPSDFVTSISFVINGTQLFADVKLPFLFKYVLQLSFNDIIRNTRKIIDWDWLFPNEDNFELYASNQSFAAYMKQNFAARDLDSIEYFFSEYKTVQWYGHTLVDFVNYVLTFLKNASISFYQFYPLENNRQRLSLSNNYFLYRYADNVVQYLYRFHGLYASFENNLPQYVFFTDVFEELETQLYILTIRYPQFFYLVLIDELQSSEGETIRKTVAWRAYIPYITPAGEFDFYYTYFGDIESEVIDNKVSNRQYSYRVMPLKVPFSYDKKF